VSGSGYGDGGYNCYTAEVDGEIVAIKIVFIGYSIEEVFHVQQQTLGFTA
jgi:hypothetical protein